MGIGKSLTLLLAGCFAAASQPARSVAVTLDDLPLGQHGPGACGSERVQSVTRAILTAIRDEKAPVTAFVITSNCADLTAEQRRSVLRMWQSAGVELGNHTDSHPDLNSTPIAD